MPHPWETAWEVLDRLSVGGQGVTHLVKAKIDGSQGVLKYLKNNKSAAARGRMRREVASLQSLAPLGASVPKVIEHNTDAADDASVELYLVMEHIPGQTLKQFVEGVQRLPVDSALRFTLELCRTVGIAHKETVVHRDLKPDNIIVTD